MEIAAENGIPASTYYHRIKKGWDVEKARTERPRKVSNIQRSEAGEAIATGLGKRRSIRLSQDLDLVVDKLIEDSGLTAIEFFRQILEPKIKSMTKNFSRNDQELSVRGFGLYHPKRSVVDW